MKTRRNVFIAFVVVAVLLMSIGYAALIDTLTIGGTAKGNGSGDRELESEFDLYFESGALYQRTTESITARIGNPDETKDHIAFGIEGLAVKGDMAILRFTIVNASTSQYPAQLNVADIDFGKHDSKINVSARVVDFLVDGESTGYVSGVLPDEGEATATAHLEPGEKCELYIFVELTESLLTASDKLAENEFTITIKPFAYEASATE